jgi:filamentous hemagglutinin family protein
VIRPLAAAVSLALAFGTQAQVAADGSLGTQVSVAGGTFGITAGTQVGNNLFHSFQTFNLTSVQTASFSGPAGIANVIGRITGGAPSSIDGTIQNTIAGANTWLMNPAGMMFGPNARLDVRGSFHASTASYLKFGSSGQFGMSGAPASTLTVNPTAFGFLGAAAPITLNGSVLQVPIGSTISLAGGNITMSSDTILYAPGGRINLASAASAGEMQSNSSGIDGVGFSAYGDIALADTLIVTRSDPGFAPGPVYIRGGRLTLEDSIVSSENRSNIAGSPGGDIAVDLSGALTLRGSSLLSRSKNADFVTDGDAGNVRISAASVSMSGVGGVDAGAAFGNGVSGSVTIAAAGDVAISSGAAVLTSTFIGAQNAGNIAISARNLTLDNGLVSASTFGEGNAGDIVVRTGNLTLANGGAILANTTFHPLSVPGNGHGGNIRVTASGAVEISGEGSGLFSRTTTFGAGGTIDVAARDMRVADRGRISSESHDPRGLLGTDLGNAGSINLSATGSIVLENDGAITTQALTAGGGLINIHAADSLLLSGSRITTSVGDGAGNGGDINIDPVFVVLNASQILAQAVGGNGGDITIVTQFLLQSPDSLISASSQKGISGTILISSPNTDVGSRLAALPSSYQDASQLLRESCATRAGRVGNSFVGVGRGGLPAAPEGAAFAAYPVPGGKSAGPGERAQSALLLCRG